MNALSPILITGATGFAGGHLVEHLASTGHIVGWGRSTPHTALAGLATWQAIDLLDRDGVRTAIAGLRPSAIYHLAGAPQVAGSWLDATTPLEANVRATAYVLDAVRRAGIRCRVLIAGSAAIYAPSTVPIAEDGAVAVANPYALSKLAQEQLALRAYAVDGIEIVAVRPFNHTGPRQQPDFVLPSIARQIARIERGLMPPAIQVGNLDARRDFSDVRDVVRAYVALMAHGVPGEIYNVGSGIGRSIRSVLDALLSRANASIEVNVDPAKLRPADVSSLVADSTRLREATGWRPQITFDQTLDDLLAYWRTEDSCR